MERKRHVSKGDSCGVNFHFQGATFMIKYIEIQDASVPGLDWASIF